MMQFLFSEEKCFACTLSLSFFPLVFLSIVFFHFAAKARIKGDVSFLDVPDA